MKAWDSPVQQTITIPPNKQNAAPIQPAYREYPKVTMVVSLWVDTGYHMVAMIALSAIEKKNEKTWVSKNSIMDIGLKHNIDYR